METVLSLHSFVFTESQEYSLGYKHRFLDNYLRGLS